MTTFTLRAYTRKYIICTQPNGRSKHMQNTSHVNVCSVVLFYVKIHVYGISSPPPFFVTLSQNACNPFIHQCFTTKVKLSQNCHTFLTIGTNGVNKPFVVLNLSQTATTSPLLLHIHVRNPLHLFCAESPAPCRIEAIFIQN